MTFMEKFFTPAPADLIRMGVLALVGGLRLYSGGSDIDREMVLKPFLDEMAKWPADCAMRALKEGRKHGVKVQAEDIGRDAALLMAERGLIRNAMRHAIKNPDEIVWANMSDEDREANRLAVLKVMRESKVGKLPESPPHKTQWQMAEDLRKAGQSNGAA